VIALSTDGPSGRLPAAHETVSDFSRRCGLDLLRFAYLLCGDRHRAEDLLQEVLLAMFRRFGDDLPLDNPVGYARRALANANANVSWSRRAASREIVTENFPETPSAGPDDSAERDLLWQASRHLPARQRTVLVMRFYADADATDSDIASALGCRAGTVRSLASRALATLRLDSSLELKGGAS
jgi:RNA polymerase sigma-70 factor (sigma-E family)